MAYKGALNKWNMSFPSVVIGTAGTKTIIADTNDRVAGYHLQNLKWKGIQVHNHHTASCLSGIVECSNDYVHWGTLTAIYGGTLDPSTSWFYNGTNAWNYLRCAVVYAADEVGTISVTYTF